MAYPNPLKNKRILITCGPTWIPIDDTRIISNISTGKLGQIMAEAFLRQGAKVTLLEGPVAESLKKKGLRTVKFRYYDEFAKALRKELKKRCHAVIHAAAVSDFKLKRFYRRKIRSDLKNLRLDLVQTRKIIDRIKKTNRGTFLVGFKLSSSVSRRTVFDKTRYLFEKADCDIVIANSLNRGRYRGFILDRDRNILTERSTRRGMANALVSTLKKRL